MLALPNEALFADTRARLRHIPVVIREPGTAALSARGLHTSRRNGPGQMAFENYW